MVDNLHVLFIIMLVSLFFLVPFSVLLNIVTLGIVASVLYILFTVYTRRQDRAATMEDVAKDLMSDPLVVGRAYFSEPATGPIGDFTGVSSWPDDNGMNRLTHEIS